jgi:hypothetical protein
MWTRLKPFFSRLKVAFAALALLTALGVYTPWFNCSLSLILSTAWSRPAGLAELYPALAHLPETPAVTIELKWSGLSDESPISAKYTLIRHGDQFGGVGEFFVEKRMYQPAAPDEPIAKANTTRLIIVPSDLIQKLLAAAGEVPASLEDYKPRRTHTDDYPYLQVDVQTPKGLLRIKTASQHEYPPGGTYLDRTPWAIEYLGQTYVVNANDLDKAWDALVEHLRFSETVDELYRQLRSSAQSTGGDEAHMERADFYEEDTPGKSQSKRDRGSVVWRMEVHSDVRATIEIPDRHMNVDWILKQNTDRTISAGHAVLITFATTGDGAEQRVSDLTGMQMTCGKNIRPLAGQVVRITDSAYMMFLGADANKKQNAVMPPEG